MIANNFCLSALQVPKVITMCPMQPKCQLTGFSFSSLFMRKMKRKFKCWLRHLTPQLSLVTIRRITLWCNISDTKKIVHASSATTCEGRFDLQLFQGIQADKDHLLYLYHDEDFISKLILLDCICLVQATNGICFLSVSKIVASFLSALWVTLREYIQWPIYFYSLYTSPLSAVIHISK